MLKASGFLIIFATSLLCRSTFAEDLDLNSILDDDLMPTSLLLVRQQENIPEERYAETELETSVNGSFDTALMSMNFHRKMMNEYQCRNFLAERILQGIDLPRLEDRLGKPFTLPKDVRKQTFEVTDQLRKKFMGETGSASYKDWLDKISTLEDIYRHYNSTQSDNDGRRRFDQFDNTADYQGGEVTGYAIPMPPPPLPPPVHQGPIGFDFPQSSEHNVHLNHYEEADKRHGHGLSLKDLFEISLTGIAFLSFGMFILQVIMCISMNKNQLPIQAMQVMDGTGDTVELDQRFRSRRSITDFKELNEICRHALLTIDNDSDECVKRHICAGNKFSRGLGKEMQVLLPLWNIGIAWLWKDSGMSMLRAAALGLGGADCDVIFKTSKC